MISPSSCPKCDAGGGSGPHPAGCTPESRFWRRIKKVGGCWEWQGARHPRGYGQFRIGNGTKRGQLIFAHRFAYEGSYGEAPSGMHVMHTCDNPRCCRPAHLVLGTPADNMQDMWRKGRGSKYRQPLVTACIHGHEYTPENTYTTKDGFRSCRTCHRERERARKRRIAA